MLLDRDDFPFETGTAYSVIVLHPALQRYAGNVTAAAVTTDGTGLNTGTLLTVTSFDNDNRVTRCILTNTTTGQTWDNPVIAGTPGFITIQPIVGCTPAAGMTYQLFDTDVMETRSVTGISAGGGSNPPAGAVMLSSPFSIAPRDFSTYFYGPAGTQKLVRITSITKASEFRSTVEWIDYSASVYVDATPIIGETSALVITNPGVTSLKAAEISTKVNGSYVTSVTLTWLMGPNTAGVGIYAVYDGATTKQPQMIARLTGYVTSYTLQPIIGVEQTFSVVGFDSDDDYAAFSTAPSVTITAEGITGNLLLGSSFATGFAYWNVMPRAGDTLVPDLSNDGEAVYSVAGTTLTTSMELLDQIILPGTWTVGEYLMLSAYFEDSAVSSSAPNVGQLTAALHFFDSSGTFISGPDAAVSLNGVTPSLVRVNTAATVIPAGTSIIKVQIGVTGSGLSIPVGSTLTMSHLLLEVASSGQTTPSAWADLDANGTVLDLFTAGSSTGLRVQGSVVPSFTGSLGFTQNPESVVISWTSLLILWPDGAYTKVQDGSQTVTGLDVSTTYFAFPYFDIINGGVKFATPTTAFGTPAILSAAYDALADAFSRGDGRVALAAGGLQVTTPATGGSPVTGTGGGGTATGGDGGGPVDGSPYPVV